MATRQNLIDTYLKNPTLQSRYTQQQYLDLFGFGQSTTPTTPTPTTPTTPTSPGQNIIGQNLNQNQGGDNFSPYNPDPNKVRTDYRPNYDYRQFAEYGFDPSTMDRKQMDMNQEYFYGKPPSGIQQAILSAAGMIPGVGPVIKGAQFLGGAIKDIFPVNQRAILENELRGSGIYTDDIGRIVVGPGGKYNTPEGIMAGYSANQMTDKTFDKRTDTISKSLERKASKAGLNISAADLQDIVDEIATTGTYSGSLTDEDFGVNNLFSNLVNVNIAKFNFKNKQKKAKDIYNFKVAEKARKKEEAKKKKIIDDMKKGNTGDGTYGTGSDGQKSHDFGTGFGTHATSGGPVSNKTGRGRTDYDDGGRVYLYDRQEMSEGGEVESYEDIIDAYENGVGVLKGESLTDYIRRNRIKLMDPMGDLEKALFGKANGGPISESDFPFLINRPGENTGRKKPGLSDYDRDTQDYEYYDDDIIEIPLGKMMKKKTKKKKKKKDREDYSDGGRVYLYDRQD